MKDESLSDKADPGELDFEKISAIWRRSEKPSERHALYRGSDAYRLNDESFSDNEDPREIDSENDSTIRRRAEKPSEQQVDMFKVKFYEWVNFISTVLMYGIVSASV